jgi:hypothetical protein
VSRTMMCKPTNGAGLLYCIYSSSPLPHVICDVQIQDFSHHVFLSLWRVNMTLCAAAFLLLPVPLPTGLMDGTDHVLKVVLCPTLYRILLLLKWPVLLMELLPSLGLLVAVTIALLRSWCSIVGIVTVLWAGLSGVWIPVEARDFSLVQYV